MAAVAKIRKSRASWKRKAIDRGEVARYERKEKIRVQRERDGYKDELAKTAAALSDSQKLVQKYQAQSQLFLNMSQKANLIHLALMLFCIAGLSFGAISRVLKVFQSKLGLKRAPCKQTISNWLVRLSIARMKRIPQVYGEGLKENYFSNGAAWIIDISIALSGGKILTVLALDVRHYATNAVAPKLEDVRCLGSVVSYCWDGKSLAAFLEEIIRSIGRPMFYIKDGGRDLEKASGILVAKGLGSHSIVDITHFFALLLKHAYENHPLLASFLTICGQVSKKLKQTLLACLAPPNISTKARFANLHRVIAWANMLLAHSRRGRAAEGSMLKKLRSAIGDMPQHKAFIQQFLADSTMLNACQKIIKTFGLSEESWKKCQPLVDAAGITPSISVGVKSWAAEHLKLGKSLGIDSLPVSSDTIESLFGRGKCRGSGAIKDPNWIALRLPTLCGPLTLQDAQDVLAITVAEQQELTASIPSIIKQRREVLPKPGRLESLAEQGKTGNIKLLPPARTESRSKTNLNPCLPVLTEIITGPGLRELPTLKPSGGGRVFSEPARLKPSGGRVPSTASS